GGLGDAGERAGELLQEAHVGAHVGEGHLGHLGDVRTGGEDLLPAPDDDRGDVVALRGLVGDLDETTLHRRVEGVHLRAVEDDRADPVGDLEPDDIAHACDSPSVASPPSEPSGSWPVARWCHSCTPWRTSGRARPSRPRTSAPRGRMCSLVTRRVSPATAALTRLKATLRSLLTCRRSTGSVGTGSSSAHWPKT